MNNTMPDSLQVKHFSDCLGCRADWHGITISQAAMQGDVDFPTGPWVAYYTHNTPQDGLPGCAFQVVADGLTQIGVLEKLEQMKEAR